MGYGLWAMDKGEAYRETIVIGDVYNAYTGEPLANVHIYFQGTDIGTTSSPEGMFLLRGSLDKKRTMVVSAVGYHTERVSIEAGQQVGVQIALLEKIANLSEVFVTPGANPALPLMEQVRKQRALNHRPTDIQQANMQTALYVSDIQSKHLQRHLWKSLQAGMLQAEDSTYLIPLYWRKQEATEVEERATLLTLTDYHILLNQLQSTCNFYDNHVNILSASLLSPLASSGSTYYNYYLADSVQAGNEKHYIVHFRTKNAFYATFNGEMTIDSATCALRSIQASVPAQNSINYLRQLNIRQTFGTDSHLLAEDMSMLMDFAIKADTSRIFPTLFLTRNTQLDNRQWAMGDGRLEMGNRQLEIDQAMDSISNTPLFRTAKFLAYVAQTGYIPTRTAVEVGKVDEVIRINSVEGLRLAFPIRTTEQLWKNVSLGGYLAYGTKDRAWKGMGEINIQLPTERQHTIQLRYGDHYIYSDMDDFQENIRENSVFNPRLNLVSEIFRSLHVNTRYYYNTMVRRQEARIHFADDWNKYLETQAYAKMGRMGYGIPTINYTTQPSFRYNTIGATARISFDERKVDYYFHRRHIYNHLPVIFIGAELGSYQTLDMPSYRMYGNLQVMLRHDVNLGMGGRLNYLVQAGMIFGKVPYPLLHIFAANPSYTMDLYRFALINTYQYAADRYLSLHANWDGRGVLFNLIPGVRYLRLRELVTLKVAYGHMHNAHMSVLPIPTLPTDAPSSYKVLSAPTTPHVEMGVGVGNILRIGEVYAVFRLTDIRNPYAPWWGLRFRLSLGL
jgi:hypothetical protein